MKEPPESRLPKAHAAYESVFREELATRLHPTVANELRWFYRSADITGTVDRTRSSRARRALGAPRFRAIRKAWFRGGDRVVDVAMSTGPADAIAPRERSF